MATTPVLPDPAPLEPELLGLPDGCEGGVVLAAVDVPVELEGAVAGAVVV